MMIVLRSILPFLITAHSFQFRAPLYNSHPWTNQRATPTKFSPSSFISLEEDISIDDGKEDKSISKIMSEISGTYDDLSPSIHNSHSYGPTLTFSYVPPPEENDDGRPITDTGKPIALYLPGLDGVGISATAQFPDLSRTFELWRMTVDRKNDRSSFGELVSAAASFIWDVAEGRVGNGDVVGREVVLIGESFGGLLAPGVAMRVAGTVERKMKKRKKTTTEEEDEEEDEGARNPLKGMVLVNPATSFDDTNWDALGPLLASLRHLEDEESSSSSLPTPYSVVGGMALAAAIPDSTQFRRILSIFASVDVDLSPDGITETLQAMRDGFGILAENLPAEVVEHRVTRWLPVGAKVVNARLDGLQVPTLVVAGEDDNMLPTKEEAKRLAKTMPNCTTTIIKGAGHFVLDDRVNLTQTILQKAPFRTIESNPARPFDASYDPILDWRFPSQSAIRDAIDNRIEPMRKSTSPVFFSTDENGRRYTGLGQLPKDGDVPILFVGNHQFLGMDLGLIIAELIEEREMIARGLAHPVIFGAAGGGGGGGGGGLGGAGGLVGDFQTFGAVMVTPKNYYRLMSTNQNAMLFPGGVREVFHNKDEAYQLFWPDDNEDGSSRSDFVRTAAKFNATIIPFSAVGAFDSYNLLVQPRDVGELPFGLGERAKNFTDNVVSARFNQDMAEESFVPPLAVPKPLQARHYFIFGTPLKTTDLDSKDREGCRMVYKKAKMEVQRGLDDLVEVRAKDPFGDTLKRLRYEAIWGKKAPTFPVDELNR